MSGIGLNALKVKKQRKLLGNKPTPSHISFHHFRAHIKIHRYLIPFIKGTLMQI